MRTERMICARRRLALCAQSGHWGRLVISLELRSDGMVWVTIFAVVGLLTVRLVSGTWPWQASDNRHDKRYYVGLVGLWVVGWIAVLAF